MHRSEENPTDLRISVVTACYNAADFVAETIESVLNQNHQSVEHILVNDASTDGSGAILESYRALRPDRIQVVSLPQNRGASHARNVGASIAKGDLLLFLDADDKLSPETLSGFAEVLYRNPGCIAYCPWRELHRSKESGHWKITPRPLPLPKQERNQIMREWLEGVSWVPPVAVCWSRDAFSLSGGWDESVSLNDDGDLMLRALLAEIPLVASFRGEGLYRSHGDERVSLSQSFVAEEKLFSQKRVLDRLACRIKERGELLEFAESLGIAYQRASLVAFQNAHTALGRTLLKEARLYGSHKPVSRTTVGRFLVSLLGIERKEQMLQALARIGIMTPERRRVHNLQRLALPAERRGS